MTEVRLDCCVCVSVFVSLCVCVFICVSLCLSLCICVSLSVSVCIPLYLSLCLHPSVPFCNWACAWEVTSDVGLRGIRGLRGRVTVEMSALGGCMRFMSLFPRRGLSLFGFLREMCILSNWASIWKDRGFRPGEDVSSGRVTPAVRKGPPTGVAHLVPWRQ